MKNRSRKRKNLIQKKMNSKDRTIQNRLFDIAWIIFLITQMITLTAEYAISDSGFKVIAYKGAVAICCALCVAVIIINLIRKEYKLKTFICYAVFGVVCLLSWYFSRDNLLLQSFLLFGAAYEISGRRIISISAFITGASLFITVISSRLGLSIDYIFDAETRARHGLGYSWATNAPTLLLFFALQYIFLRKNRMRVWEYIILELANVYLFIETDTNQPFLIMTVFLICFFIEGLFRNNWRVIGRLNILWYILPIAICLITIAIYAAFDPQIGFWDKLNVALNHRLGLGRNGIDSFGITAFGQQIVWNGNSISGAAGDYNYVDCSYMQILLNYGVLFLAASAAVYTRLVYRAARFKDYWLVMIAVVVLLHSFTEPRMMNLTLNIIPVLAFARLGEERVEYRRGFLKMIMAGTAESDKKAKEVNL